MEEQQLDNPGPPAYLGNIAIWAADFDAMRNFYSNLVGVPELAQGDRPRKWCFYGNEIFSFSLNEATFTPEPKGWARCPMNPSLGEAWEPYITIYVPDIQEVMARCRKAGVQFHSGEPFSLGEGFGVSIEARDPDGNTIALTQKG